MATQSRMASLTASLSVRLPGEGRADLGAQQPHAEDVERLALHVDLAHVDEALLAEEGRRGGGGDPVLAGAGLGDDPALAHALGQQRLAQDVVDLVRPGVVEVLPLEQEPEAEELGEVGALGERRRAAGVVAQQPVEAGAEGRVGPGVAERGLQLGQRGDQRLGDEAAAEAAEAPVGVGLGHGRGGWGGGGVHVSSIQS